jgi:hypothetical protein
VALATPLLDRASAEPNTGGGKVTCSGGGEPGDVQETHTYYYVNGKYVTKVTGKTICGKGGRWHIVARTVSGHPSLPVLSTGSPASIG